MFSKITRYIFTLAVLAVVAYIFLKPEPMQSLLPKWGEAKSTEEAVAAPVADIDTLMVVVDSMALDSLERESQIIDTLKNR